VPPISHGGERWGATRSRRQGIARTPHGRLFPDLTNFKDVYAKPARGRPRREGILFLSFHASPLFHVRPSPRISPDNLFNPSSTRCLARVIYKSVPPRSRYPSSLSIILLHRWLGDKSDGKSPKAPGISTFIQIYASRIARSCP